jgi:hypothetical protein
MFNALFVYIKYPSTAGVIAAIWIGSGILVLIDRRLPILTMIEFNMIVSILIAFVGFRVDKKYG